MMNKEREIMEVAKTLGYKGDALPRETLDHAFEFMRKQTERLGAEDTERILYATQTVINTMAWIIASKVIKDEN